MENRRDGLQREILTEDDALHQYVVIVLAWRKVVEHSTEARSCIGAKPSQDSADSTSEQELDFFGDGTVRPGEPGSAEEPEIDEDIETGFEDPETGDDVDILPPDFERPGDLSPGF